ncbi:hypothetical protein BDY19DRAFT_188691 [Irpex rosettiformis]|uniref:Uncharacterized protein n=1 Tax=Irpex rosettiformis TaxID=378272 RepID=A0ACB8U1W7_9APHY|nr:hypothetical protein BDY19DRAFT_188691 [Irpex rosettiformis]
MYKIFSTASSSDKQTIVPAEENVVVAMREAFEDMAGNSNATLNAFQEILAELACIPMIVERSPLYERWERICVDFRSALRDSHKCASKISARMKCFYKVLRPVVLESKLPNDVKLQIVNNFIIACEESEEQAVESVKKFDHIFDQVNKFEKLLVNFVSGERADIRDRDRGIRERITRVDGEIINLRAKLATAAIAVAAVAVTFGALTLYAPANVTVLKFAMPVVEKLRSFRWHALLPTCLGVNFGVNTYNNIQDKTQERSGLKMQLEELMVNRDHIQIVSKQLGNMQTRRIAPLKQKIELFTTAWKRLINACVQLQEVMSDSKSYVNYPKPFELALDSTCDLFKALTECLDAYAAEVEVGGSKE